MHNKKHLNDTERDCIISLEKKDVKELCNTKRKAECLATSKKYERTLGCLN